MKIFKKFFRIFSKQIIQCSLMVATLFQKKTQLKYHTKIHLLIAIPPLCLFYSGKRENYTSLFSKNIKKTAKKLKNIQCCRFTNTEIQNTFQKNGVSVSKRDDKN